jgi:hypothetical protein
MKKQEESNIENIHHIVRKRINTSHDWMANSDIPGECGKNIGASNMKQPSEIGTEVEIRDVRMFKQKNRASRVDKFGIVEHDGHHLAVEREGSECHSRR